MSVGFGTHFGLPSWYHSNMTPKLTPEMREAIVAQHGAPIAVEDELTKARYVLLPLTLYQKVKSIFADESFDVADTYAAQSSAAGVAGWDDPEMAVYDDYDAHRAQP